MIRRALDVLTSRIVEASGLFDAYWYTSYYKDVGDLTHTRALDHYIHHGGVEGRDPSPIFSTRFYLSQFPTLDPRSVNPLCHYIVYGEKAGAWPNPWFDPVLVDAVLPADKRNGSLLSAYNALGPTTLNPSAGFDAAAYLANRPLLRAAGINPLWHFACAQHLDFHPPLVAAPELACISSNDLALIGIQEGRNLFHVTGGDPYLVLRKGDGAPIAPGHYQLKCTFSGPHGALTRAKIYFDYGEGFNEDCARPLSFEQNASGIVSANLSLAMPAGKLRFDPMDRPEDPATVVGFGPITLSAIGRLEHYNRLAARVAPSPGERVQLGIDLSSTALREGPGAAAAKLRRLYQENCDRSIPPAPPKPVFEPVNPFDGEGFAETETKPCTFEGKVQYQIRNGPKIPDGADVLFLVLYCPDGRTSPLQKSMVMQWADAGYSVIVIANVDSYDERITPDAPGASGLIIRENRGFDFGGWRDAAQLVELNSTFRSVTFTNDSLAPVGGAASLKKLREKAAARTEDIVFCTQNLEVRQHLQSYWFSAQTQGGYEALRKILSQISYYFDKDDLIYNVELNLIDKLRDEDISHGVLFEIPQADEEIKNPTIHFWRELIDNGFPFWKIQLLTAGIVNLEEDDLQSHISSESMDLILDHLSRRVQRGKSKTPYSDRCSLSSFTADSRFNEYGAQNAYNPTPDWFRPITLPLGSIASAPPEPTRIAGIIHCFYVDVAEEILDQIAQLSVQVRLVLTTDTKEKASALRKLLAEKNLKGEVVVTPNRGRDVAPFLIAGKAAVLESDVLFHLHTKKSKHDERYADWGAFLRENLIVGEGKVESIVKLLQTGNIGLVYSEHFSEVANLRNWGFDFTKARQLLSRLGVAISADNLLEFPTSTMFWARSDALRPLFELGLNYTDFDKEAGQIDGTLAHAVERSLLLIAESQGYQAVSVVSDRADPQYLERATSLDVKELDSLMATPTLPLLKNKHIGQNTFQHVGEVYPVNICKSGNLTPRINFLVPTLKPEKVYGGISTAVSCFRKLIDQLPSGTQVRIVVASDDVDKASLTEIANRLSCSVTKDSPKGDPAGGVTIVDLFTERLQPVSLRSNDFFFATAWWTADLGFRLVDQQSELFGAAHPLVYLIQDYEPGFYSWSDHYAMAEATYHRQDDTLAIINSEELFKFMQDRYAFAHQWCVGFELNNRLSELIRPTKKEPVVICYGRPGTSRNCFHIIKEGLRIWQSDNPHEADQYEIVFAGEPVDDWHFSNLHNARSAGKLSLDDYASLLNRSAIGVSLMVSPHPSYPPLEMASAGCWTITNSYECKDLSERSDHIISLDAVTPQQVARALSTAAGHVKLGDAPRLENIRPIGITGDYICYKSVAGAMLSRLGAVKD